MWVITGRSLALCVGSSLASQRPEQTKSRDKRVQSFAQMDEDILEVGEDGAFEIVSTKTVKQPEVVHPTYEVSYAPEDEEDVQQKNHEVLQALKAGEYKIYRSAGSIYVILRLPEGEQTVSVGVQSQTLKVQTESGNTHNVPLAEAGHFNTKDGRCTVWKDFLTVKYPVE